MTKRKVRHTLTERLWKKFVRDDNGCWIWTGTIAPTGYGMLSIGRVGDGTRRFAYGHRVMYELIIGPIPEGLQIDHLCRNRACVNPAHLEPVSQQENIERGYLFRLQQPTCSNGHTWTDESTYWRGRTRQCRHCDAARSARRQRRRSA